MLRRCGETGQPGGPFFKITVFRLAVFEDFVFCGGDARGYGRVVRRAIGTGVVEIPCRGGESAVVTGLPFTCAELLKIGHGNVVVGVRAHAVDHDDQRLRLLLFLCGKWGEADNQEEKSQKMLHKLGHGRGSIHIGYFIISLLHLASSATVGFELAIAEE